MANTRLLCLTLLIFIVMSVRAAVSPGRCPIVPVKGDFNVTKYLGVWYDIRSYYALFQASLNCSKSNYTGIDASHFRVNNSATALDKQGHKIAVNATGIASAPNPSIPSKLNVKFDKSRGDAKPGDYWVVETDYTNYAIVWSCKNIASGLLHKSQSWILGRNQTGFTQATEADIDKALASHNIDATLYEPVVQTDCVN